MPLPDSKHFHLEPLTDGVYAAISRADGVSISNAAIVDLGDRTLVFDTFAMPQAARDLVAAAQQITGRAVSLAINSHWHSDHVLGNQALPPGCLVISTTRTRELIAAELPAHIAMHQENDPAHLASLEQQLLNAETPAERERIGQGIDFFRMVLDDLPHLRLMPPALTFDHRMTLNGDRRRAELLTFGGGHTESDAVLWLPDDQIMLMGDLLFYEAHPWLGDGDPDAWLRILGEIDELTPPVEIVLPGHGVVTQPAAFAHIRRYVPALRELVADARARSHGLSDLEETPIPAAFSAWGSDDTFRRNLEFLFKRLDEA